MAIDICATRLDVAANRPVDGVRPEFAERALVAFSAGKLPGEVLQLSGPRIWSVFLLLASLVAGGVAVSALGSVEVTARGRGMVRGAERPVALQAATTGRLDAWRVKAGDKVAAGEIIATLDAADLRAAAAEAQRQAGAVEARAAATARTISGKYDEQRKAFADEGKKLEAQLAVMHDTETMYQRHVAVMKDLARRQFASRHDVDDTAEKLNQIHQDILAAEGQLAEVRQRVSGLEADEQRERLSLTQEVSEAQARRDRTTAMMQEAVLRAPSAGVVDALLVQPGEVVQAGATLGRLVPESAAATVTAVIEERNRAFLQVGSPVRLELDQLPPGEFGALHGTVRRVGADLIPAAELRDMVGVNGTGAWYKVEIALTDDARAQSLSQYLRPGMLVTARYHLRQRRIITLALEPLRYWLKD